MIMVRAAGPTGQSGRNGHVRARREGVGRLSNGIARGERFLYPAHESYLTNGVYWLIRLIRPVIAFAERTMSTLPHS
jgi:hypothetical protein